MNIFHKNITFIIVTYRSENVIEKCLKKIPKKCKIIIVENSNDFYLKKKIIKKYPRIKFLINKKNYGYGKANNIGILNTKTKYAFILNPDAILQKNTIFELKKAIKFLLDDFSIISPNLDNNYGYFNKQKKINIIHNLLDVDYVKGFAMLLNLEKIKNKKIFDENFFLFLEEIDFCKRIKNLGGKIYIAMKSRIDHVGKNSSKVDIKIELCRNWHWMWSLFYFNNKHYGTLIAYKITLFKFFSTIIKLFFNLIFFKKNFFLINKFRLLGLIDAYLGRSSSLRPEKLKL
jgi:N-acetylglucosaminyl-diphospho-decaprenol L-rhamnosyltransferase